MSQRKLGEPEAGHFVAQFENARAGRPLWMRGFNRVAGLLPGLARLSADAYWEAARRGLEDAPDPSPAVVKALEVLVDSIREDSRLNAIGRLAARDDTVRMARNHLRIQDLRQARPELQNVDWPAPIFIVGMPRTGTTFLHQLMASDPASRSIPYWESFDPIPPEEPPDRRAAPVDRMLKQLESLSPNYHAIHPMTAEGAEECVALFMNDLRTLQFDLQYRVPSYVDWLLGEDARIAYGSYREQLQIIQSFRPCGERSVLKDPTHLVHLETVLELFPDARIVFTHRDPAHSISSVASLMAHTRAIFSDDVDPYAIGQEVLSGHWPTALEQAQRIRSAHPDRTFADVRQADLALEPIDTLRKLYGDLGLSWRDETEAGMRSFVSARNAGPRNRHIHRPEGFGLSREEIRERLKAYVEAFDL